GGGEGRWWEGGLWGVGGRGGGAAGGGCGGREGGRGRRPKSREGSGRAQRKLTRYTTATASEKLFRCKDLLPACRERNRAHRCNRCSVRRDWSRNHSCPAPASRSANRLPSWKPLVSPSACYVRSAARSH